MNVTFSLFKKIYADALHFAYKELSINDKLTNICDSYLFLVYTASYRSIAIHIESDT
jgi:hypothetical protein